MAATGAPLFEIRVLGPVEVERDGVAVALGGPRQRALLALLALHAGRSVSTDRLVDELWAGEPPDGAEATLRTYVSRLRAALHGIEIQGSRAGYAIDRAGGATDARRFESLIRDADAMLARRAVRAAGNRYRAALAMWRGRPYGGLSDDGALRVEADRLEELRLHAIEQRIAADLQGGAAAELVDELEELVSNHPLRERLWRHLMLALYRSDRQADALGAYRRARDLLNEELGLEPAADLRALELAILRHEVPPAVPIEVRHNLPAPLTSFIGRAAELADVARLLGQARLVTLTGVGGVGKTRLALEAAARAVIEHPDGVTFVDLAPITDPTLVAGHVGSALEIREQPGVPVMESLVAQLRDRHLLLVLDNCEHVRPSCAELTGRLLAACPELRVLATSREVLGVPGETDYPVPPLGLPARTAELAAARESESVQLLLDRVRAARPRLQETDETIASAVQIVADLEGLPLAIELAAARAKALSLSDIAARLDDRFRFLVTWRRLTTARHRTLREAMDWSFSLLAPDEQDLLMRLSVFAGGFSAAAAAAVATSGDEVEALRLIERLVDASLVAPVEVRTGTRYGMLETVRQYGVERLVEAGLHEAAAGAHARYFVHLAEAAPMRGAAQSAGLVVLDVDSDNVRASIERAADAGDIETEQRLAGAMWRYWWVRGRLAEGRARLEAALGRGERDSSAARRRLLIGAAGLAWTTGDYGRAKSFAQEALAAADLVDDDADRMHAHTRLGVIAMSQRDYTSAENHHAASMRLARRIGSEIDVIVAKLNLGVVALNSGRIEAAVPIFEEVLAYHRRVGDREGVGFGLLNLGEAAVRLGDLQHARRSFEEARTAFESVGFAAHVGHAIQGLAFVAVRADEHREAARLLGVADAVLADVGASAEDFAPDLVDAAFTAVQAALDPELFRLEFDAGQAEVEGSA